MGISSRRSNIGSIDHISEDDSFLRDHPNEQVNPLYDFEGHPEVDEHFTDTSPYAFSKMLTKGREAWAKEPRAYVPAQTGREIPFYFDISTFRGPDSAATKSDVVVNYLIPYEPLAYDDRGVWVERRTVAIDAEQVVAGNSIEAIEQAPPRGDGRGDWILNTTSLTVPPGSYQVASRVVDLVSPKREMGLSRAQAEVPDYRAGGFQMSDVLFGSDVQAVKAGAPEGPGVRRGGWRIVPMPVRRFDGSATPHIYFEVYNLEPIGAAAGGGPAHYKYKVDYILTKREPRGFFAAVRGLFSGTLTPGVAVSFEREIDTPDAENWIAIDTSELPPDTYFLEARVTDLANGREASRKESFVIVAAGG
jgi:hypothetical protein